MFADRGKHLEQGRVDFQKHLPAMPDDPVLSALVPASIVGGSRSGFSQAACNTLKTVVVRRRKWSLR